MHGLCSAQPWGRSIYSSSFYQSSGCIFNHQLSGETSVVAQLLNCKCKFYRISKSRKADTVVARRDQGFVH